MHSYKNQLALFEIVVISIFYSVFDNDTKNEFQNDTNWKYLSMFLEFLIGIF